MSKGRVFFLTAPEDFAYYRALPLWEQEVEFHALDTALSVLQAEPPDLLLLDCGLDTERGLALLREIKAVRPEIMVLFVTDSQAEETAIQAFRQGARDYFRKPLELFPLKAVIEKLLQIKEGTREKRIYHQVAGSAARPRKVPLLRSDTPGNLLRSIHYIEKNFATTCTLELLAAAAGISPYHFCRKFKKQTGVTPMHFVTLLRIERAKALLGANLPVSSVALQVGFNDLGSFIRSFKKVTGQTPSAYKKTALDS